MTAYDVTVSREDNLWVAVVDGLAPAATDVEHFADLETEVRDLISGLTESDPDDFALRWHYLVGGEDVTEQIQRVLALESELRELQAARDRARNEAVSTLLKAGASQRAIGDVLNLSHQRVNQLINH
ncbi:MerR [Solihabitans fulvus]|uniref:MerR n=1 Tax=Solihabitans fulvus TaxID=1892852 RepID=A0A5B2X6D2_9PSEU|nr:MerR [Solihabitans fulvus]KAA2258755.1 MerR [Solihabitans fulvus]